MQRRKFIRNATLLAAAGGVGWAVLDRETLVQPGLPPLHFDIPTPRRPRAGATPYSRVPIAPTYAERRAAYLHWAAQAPTPPNRGGVLHDLIKLEAGVIKTVSAEPLAAALDFVNARRDPSDFIIADLVRLYYLHRNSGALSPQQVADVRAALLNYKYSLEEPGFSDTQMWTENHQMLSHGSEYLVGQMFPDEKFTVDGLTGREHQQKAHAEALRWIMLRARIGPAEWDSVPYYDMDLAALLNVVEFAADAELQTRATMMVDILLFDVAVNSFYGQLGTSHGRAYDQNVMSAAGDSLMTFQTLVFGWGSLQHVDMACTMLVTGKRYTTPPAIVAAALDLPAEMINRERHSIPLDAKTAAQYGLSLNNIDDFETWWGMGAFTNPKAINLTYDAVKKYNLWHYEKFASLRTLGRLLRPLGLLPTTSRLLQPASNGVLLSEVNKITYRTPDAMLSTAQDYRAGEQGYQQHIWQATLGPYAVVFATNPEPGSSPGYWHGEGRMPRNAQYRNALISIYNIERHRWPFSLALRPVGFTHAFFPRWAFDEVVDVVSPAGGGWTFGRKGDGYIALYSHVPPQWTATGPEAQQEIGAPGFQNVWICQVGRKAVDGDFASFMHALSQAALHVDGLHVTYASPGNGTMQFGWSGPLKVDGNEVALHDYPRWQNPYTDTAFGAEQAHIACKGATLDLDFRNGVRKVSA